MAANPIFIGNLKNAALVLNNASGTALQSLLAGGASGSRMKSLNASTDETTQRVLQWWVTIGGVDYLLGETTVPVGAGSDGATKPVSVLNPTDIPSLLADGVNYMLDVANGSTLKVKSKVAITAGKTIYLFGQYGDV